MELIVKPAGADLSYQAFFKDPERVIDQLKGEVLLSIQAKLAKNFSLRLNDIKTNAEAPSDNFINFVKFDGPSWFDFSFGFETVTANLWRALSEKQVTDFYFKASELFEHYPMNRQRMNIQQQLTPKEDATSYLKSLNPTVPANFEKRLAGRGVFYTLKVSEHELKIHITLASSLFVKGGIFLSIENDFSPNLYDFKKAFSIARDHRNFILEALKLQIHKEA